MFTILAHGVNHVNSHFSFAQDQLILQPAPIRICGAPTGAGKTRVFLEIAKHQLVFFVVPTQALARDIKNSADQAGVWAEVWDYQQTKRLLEEKEMPWVKRKGQLKQQQGIIVATLEALANLTIGKPVFQGADTGIYDVLWRAKHIVFDEAHTLNGRAFGLVHLLVLLVVGYHHKQRTAVSELPKLSLLSATHSNLFKSLQEELPEGYVALFDEEVVSGNGVADRPIHGNVTVDWQDKSLLEVAGKVMPGLLDQGERLLLIYDSLAQFTMDEARLEAVLVKQCGLRPEEVILINGQDKQTPYSWGGSGFEGGLEPKSKHRVIVGTSAVEMGVNFAGVNVALIEHGVDAAALLQRVGRVARNHEGQVQDGKVYVCRSSVSRGKTLSHVGKLQGLTGEYEINDLRQQLAPLRELHWGVAKNLGGAYWSMLSRSRSTGRVVQDAALPILRTLSGESEVNPGGYLNRLHLVAKQVDNWNLRDWLKQVDKELQDVRGFAPSVRVRFRMPNGEYQQGEYDEDWVRSRLREADRFDEEEGVYIFEDARNLCLREKSRAIGLSFCSPRGTISVEVRSLREAKVQYLAKLRNLQGRFESEELKKVIGDAIQFVEMTGLLVRDRKVEEPGEFNVVF